MTATGRVLAVAEAHARDLSRRRTALGFLIALPLVFYVVGAGHQGAHAIENGTIATAFSIVGAAIFTELTGRAIDQRLVLAGFQPGDLLAGRLLVLAAISVPILLGTAAVMTVVSHPDHPGLLVVAALGVGVVGVPLGLVIGLLVPRDLEAVLLLIGIVGVQLSLDRSQSLNLALPFGGPRRLVEAAVGEPRSVVGGVALTLVYAGGLLVAALGATVLRSPRPKIHRPDSAASGQVR
jgi:hypothetical protein